MKITIIPGLSSPNCDQYKAVYGPLLQEVVRRFPQANSEVVLLPGQLDASGCTEGEFLIPEAASRLRSVLETERSTEYFLIARSSGCNVVAELMSTWKDAPVKRIVFWGPPPYWLYFDMFAAGSGDYYEEALKTGVHLTTKIVQTSTPWESRLPSISCPVLLATGSQDTFCRPEYLDYIKASVPKQANFDFLTVRNCPHSVTPELPCWSDYCEAILGWLRK